MACELENILVHITSLPKGWSKLMAPEALGHLVASMVVAIAATIVPWEAVISWLVANAELSRATFLSNLPAVCVAVTSGLALFFWHKWAKERAAHLVCAQAREDSEARLKAADAQYQAMNRQLCVSEYRSRELEFIVAKRKAG